MDAPVRSKITIQIISLPTPTLPLALVPWPGRSSVVIPSPSASPPGPWGQGVGRAGGPTEAAAPRIRLGRRLLLHGEVGACRAFAVPDVSCPRAPALVAANGGRAFLRAEGTPVTPLRGGGGAFYLRPRTPGWGTRRRGPDRVPGASRGPSPLHPRIPRPSLWPAIRCRQTEGQAAGGGGGGRGPHHNARRRPRSRPHCHPRSDRWGCDPRGAVPWPNLSFPLRFGR